MTGTQTTGSTPDRGFDNRPTSSIAWLLRAVRGQAHRQPAAARPGRQLASVDSTRSTSSKRSSMRKCPSPSYHRTWQSGTVSSQYLASLCGTTRSLVPWNKWTRTVIAAGSNPQGRCTVRMSPTRPRPRPRSASVKAGQYRSRTAGRSTISRSIRGSPGPELLVRSIGTVAGHHCEARVHGAHRIRRPPRELQEGCGSHAFDAAFVYSANRTHKRRGGDAIRQLCSAGGRVGAAHREADDPEPSYLEVIGEFSDVIRPVDDPAGAVMGRPADPRAVGRNEPHAETLERRIFPPTVEPTRGRTMKLEDRLPVFRTPFRIAQAPPVTERDHIVDARRHGETLLPRTATCEPPSGFDNRPTKSIAWLLGVCAVILRV